MSAYYWGRALAAIDRKRGELIGGGIPEDPGDPVWRELENWQWLEEFAQASRRMVEEAEIF